MTLVNLDKVLSGNAGNIESVIVYADNTAAVALPDYTNGLFVGIAGLAEGHREAKIAFPAAGTEDEILLVASPELSYDERLTKEDYKNAEGSVARAYRISLGDVIQLTEDLVPASLVVGDVLVVGTDGKLVKGDDTTAPVAFTVIEGLTNAISLRQKSVALQATKA